MGRTIAQLLQEWLAVKERVLSPGAHQNLRGVVRTWMGCLGALEPERITTREIQQLYTIRDNGGRANQTLNSERAKLRQFWKWLRALNHASHDPTTAWPSKNPRKRKRKYIQLSPEWEEKILGFLKDRYRRYLVFSLSTGLRYGEVRALIWGWIDEDGVLLIPAEVRKQGEEHRLALPQHAIDALGPRQAPGDRLFPRLLATRRPARRSSGPPGRPPIQNGTAYHRTSSAAPGSAASRAPGFRSSPPRTSADGPPIRS